MFVEGTLPTLITYIWAITVVTGACVGCCSILPIGL
jgi:hypothetical protein